MRFMPTGGVNEKNLLDYLSFDKVIACGGSWMVDKQAIADKNFAKITEITRSAVQKMLGFELLHVGVNCADADEAMKVAKRFGAIFGWPVKDGNSSTFSGTAVECMKKPYLARTATSPSATTSVLRAKAYLESMASSLTSPPPSTRARSSTPSTSRRRSAASRSTWSTSKPTFRARCAGFRAARPFLLAAFPVY